MRLSIPTNWDNKLIENLSSLPIHNYYAKLQEDVVGGGRPAASIPHVTRQKVKEHIKLIHENKALFNYVLNAPCLGNTEYSPSYRKQIFQLLDWLTLIGVDSVTVTIPLLLEWIKKNFPSLKVSVSVFSHVDTINMAKMYENLGADEITITQQFNRDFNFLKSLRKNCKTDFQLIVNNACLFGCPFRRYHSNLNAHSSQIGAKKLPLDYPVMRCTLLRFKYPSEIIRSPWVRPEDLVYYEKIGIDKFKLSGRTNTTEWITKTAKAYAGRKSPKNFAELLAVPNAAGSMFRKTIPGAPDVNLVIDNDTLPGFIKHFLNKSCSSLSCDKCLYCDRIALKSVKTSKELSKKLISAYEKVLSDFQNI
ncbi:MAG: U32 family peptidase [bacterium]|nr:U32 family peptidase [bacterium]